MEKNEALKISRDATYKLCIFGNGGVGKTTLVRRYLSGMFEVDTKMTIGLDIALKSLIIKGKKILLQIWDFAGEERFRFILPGYAAGASAGIFMYDITKRTSINNIDEWLDVFYKGSIDNEKTPPILMIGGKLDLKRKRAVYLEEVKKISSSRKLYGPIECSSKTGEKVEQIFTFIGHLIMRIAGLI